MSNSPLICNKDSSPSSQPAKFHFQSLSALPVSNSPCLSLSISQCEETSHVDRRFDALHFAHSTDRGTCSYDDDMRSQPTYSAASASNVNCRMRTVHRQSSWWHLDFSWVTAAMDLCRQRWRGVTDRLSWYLQFVQCKNGWFWINSMFTCGHCWSCAAKQQLIRQHWSEQRHTQSRHNRGVQYAHEQQHQFAEILFSFSRQLRRKQFSIKTHPWKSV